MVSNPKGRMCHFQRGRRVVPFKMGIEQKGLGGHGRKGFRGGQDGEAQLLQHGFIQVIEHGILDEPTPQLTFIFCS